MADRDVESQQTILRQPRSDTQEGDSDPSSMQTSSLFWRFGAALWPFRQRRQDAADGVEEEENRPNEASESPVPNLGADIHPSETDSLEQPQVPQLIPASDINSSASYSNNLQGAGTTRGSPRSTTLHSEHPQRSVGWLRNRFFVSSHPSQPASPDGDSTGGEITPGTPLLTDDEANDENAVLDSSGSRHSTSVASSPERTGCLAPTVSALSRLSNSFLASGSLSAGSNSPSASPVSCLICLEPLTIEDFESGEAIQLECKCRGEAAMRHVTCARKWNKVKGNRICDVCKSEIRNLPAPTPPSSESGNPAEDRAIRVRRRSEVTWMQDDEDDDDPPTTLDVLYNLLKIVWVVMIICVLFFDMPFTQSLWVGVGVGMSYTVITTACSVLAHARLRRELERRNAWQTRE